MNGSFSVGYILSKLGKNFQWLYVLCVQARYQVRKPLPASKMSERCALIFVRESDCLDAFFSIKPGDTLAKDRPANVLHDLTGTQNR